MKKVLFALVCAGCCAGFALAATTYRIESGTYTLQRGDPNIGAGTVVEVAEGAVLDLNTLNPTLVAITGKGAGLKFAKQVTDGKWTAEFFVPFDCFWHPEAPKAGDKWRTTFVKTRVSDPKQLDGAALTLGDNGNIDQYAIITFK